MYIAFVIYFLVEVSWSEKRREGAGEAGQAGASCLLTYTALSGRPGGSSLVCYSLTV